MTSRKLNLVALDGRFVATGLAPGAEAEMVKSFQEARLGYSLELVPQRTAAEYGAGNAGCDQCSAPMNPAERILGPV